MKNNILKNLAFGIFFASFASLTSFAKAVVKIPNNATSEQITAAKNILKEGSLSLLNAQSPNIYPASCFTLEEITSTVLAKNFHINKYLQNEETGALTKISYNVNVSNSLGDSSSCDKDFYYYWDLSNGNLKLLEQTNASEISALNYDFSVSVNSKTNTHLYTGDDWTSGDNVSNSFVNISDTLKGGAILNDGVIIGNITGSFVSNNLTTDALEGYGGSIANYNHAQISDITGSFVGNWVLSTGYKANGGAIANAFYSQIDNIVGDFLGNWSMSEAAAAYGGAIYNYESKITSITGDFIGNWTYSNDQYAYGGAISNYSEASITDITGDFISNKAYSYGSSFTQAYGGAISNSSTSLISTIEGDFIDNIAYSNSSTTQAKSYGGAIYNSYSQIGSIEGDFINNSVYASSQDSSFCEAFGAAIYNYYSSIDSITGSFIANSAYSSSKEYANGGAIYNLYGTIGFLALNESMEFTGNYVASENYTLSNAIYNRSSSQNDTSTINFNAYNDNSIIVNDGISGQSTYISNQIIQINSAELSSQEGASSYGTVAFNNQIAYQTISLENGTLSLGSYAGGMVVATVEDQGYSYITKESTASLIETSLTVKEGAYLDIDASGVEANTSSSIILLSDSYLTFDTYASLQIDSLSTISFEDGAKVVVDLSDLKTLEFSLILICFDSSSLAQSTFDYLEENLQVVYNDEFIGQNDESLSWLLSLSENNIIITGATAVPEPATYAMIFGLLTLLFAFYNRKR